VSLLRWHVSLSKIMPAAETQTALHDSAGREVGTSSGADKHFQLRQRHQKSKGWQMGLARPICFKVRQVRLAATARLFHFLRNMRNGHLRKVNRGDEAEDGERADHVDRNHTASMDCIFNTQRYQTIHMASRLGIGRIASMHVIEALLAIKQDRRVLSSVPRLFPTTGSRLENAAAAMSASAFSPFIVGAGRHRRHDNIANSDLAKDEVKSSLSASSLT
jgi:hypothetical protein